MYYDQRWEEQDKLASLRRLFVLLGVYVLLLTAAIVLLIVFL